MLDENTKVGRRGREDGTRHDSSHSYASRTHPHAAATGEQPQLPQAGTPPYRRLLHLYDMWHLCQTTPQRTHTHGRARGLGNDALAVPRACLLEQCASQ